jgi:hypothetical protein
MTEQSTVHRSVRIEAPAEAILPFVRDFTEWPAWSPWEGQDADMQRSYTGTPGAVGSTYSWSGNRKAGAGTMRATVITPTEVEVALQFTKPFRSTSEVQFDLAPTADGRGTEVVWTMRSPKTRMSRVMGAVLNLEKFIGRDFEKGLAQLKAAVERDRA